LVPWTDELAVIATEDPIANQWPQLDGHAAARLDGEIGNAAPGVELEWRDDCARRADVEAGAAASAMRGCGSVQGEGQVGENLAEHKPRTGVAVDEIGVLALPAEPGCLRQGLLHDGTAVDEHPVAVRP